MARLDCATHTLEYRIDGDSGPWLMFCNSLGTDLHMWDEQVSALSNRFRILRYDRRGHGQSSAPPAPYTLQQLGDDVIALLDALQIERVAFCGLSLGGLVAQWLALHIPERLTHVVVCATAARIGTTAGWQERAASVTQAGLEPLRQATAERWFGDAFRHTVGARVEAILQGFAQTSTAGYVGCCAALSAADLRPFIRQISVPLLAIAGADDPVCPVPDLQAIAEGAANGMLLVLPGRHLVNVESADHFNIALQQFLEA